jgi:hypothetical protein
MDTTFYWKTCRKNAWQNQAKMGNNIKLSLKEIRYNSDDRVVMNMGPLYTYEFHKISWLTELLVRRKPACEMWRSADST